jgi:hypothetical protein
VGEAGLNLSDDPLWECDLKGGQLKGRKMRKSVKAF